MIGDLPGGPGRPVSDAEDTPTRAVVLIDRDGLRIIVGRSGAQPEDMLSVTRAGVEVPFSLIKVTPRMYLYREMVPPRSGRFNESFHKDQV